MIARFLRRWLTRCPPAGRQLGLLREHEDIARRHARVPDAWAGHLAASKEAILAAVDGRDSGTRRRVLVIGAGDCLDVPVAGLAERFEQVVLADIVVSAAVRGWVRRFPSRVQGVVWDASGALAALAAQRETVTAAAALEVFAQADAGPPPDGEPDFIVSANCLSQLGLVPGHSLSACAQDKTLPERCARVAARRHLAWLAARPAAKVVLADVARLDIAADGRTLKRETLFERFGLSRPDRTWRWELAPIPEWSPDFHRVHEVGAWIFPPGG